MVTLEQYKIKYRELYKRMERVRNLASVLVTEDFGLVRLLLNWRLKNIWRPLSLYITPTPLLLSLKIRTLPNILKSLKMR